MRICNIKISLQFKDELIQSERSNEKKIWKEGYWTITQYLHSSRLINVTGLKSEFEINNVIEFLEMKFSCKCIHSQIDSIMISHKDFKRLKLNDVCLYLPNQYYVDYNPELFTGMFLKSRDCNFPTINLFYTGSYQILALKSFEKMKTIISMIQSIIEKCEV